MGLCPDSLRPSDSHTSGRALVFVAPALRARLLWGTLLSRCREKGIAVAVGEDSGTVEEVYEPYLIQEGFMARTPRGRVAARRAYEHFDLVPPMKQSDIFDDLLG